MKTPEELAEEHVENLWQNTGTEFERICCHQDFLAGYKAASPQWISVKDRLPDRNELCLVNTEWRGIVVAQYGWESWVFDEGQGYSEKLLSYAPHWMPLPKPPTEDSK